MLFNYKMKNPFRIFKIKKAEILPSLVALVYFISLNVLAINKHFELFTRCGKIGYWTLFNKNFMISGFDPQTYITLSTGRPLYELTRHPFLAIMVSPLYSLNEYLMQVTGQNCAVYIVAFFLVFFFFYSFIFLFRIFREVIGLKFWDAILLNSFFFSFAYMMLTAMSPDHFGLSFFILILFLYLSGKSIRAKKVMPSWLVAFFTVLSSGVTVTNGVKMIIADFISNNRKSFFKIKHLLIVVLLPFLILVAGYFIVDKEVQEPELMHRTKIDKQKIEKDPELIYKIKKHQRDAEARHKNALGSSEMLVWTDTQISRARTLVENLFGESILIHENHVLQDVNNGRPVFVNYINVLDYIVVCVIILLFILGCVCGFHDRFMKICLGWFAYDMLMHLVIGFAISEIYIMTAHWAFIIPISLAYIFNKLDAKKIYYLRGAVLFLTMYLLIHNYEIIGRFMLN